MKPVKRYAALLRGVSPMNAKMPELKRAFEGAGFADVKTVLASGNVLFSSPPAPIATLEKRAEAAMAAALDRGFPVIVREVDALQAILGGDPYQGARLPKGAKRVMTFLRKAPAAVPALPISRDDAVILRCVGTEVFSYYVPGPKGPVFMVLIEKTFGKDVTTRTWETVEKLAR